MTLTSLINKIARLFRSKPGEDRSEWMAAEPEKDIQYKTYIFHGNVEEADWILKWEVRDAG